jgi:hypothetical protein
MRNCEGEQPTTDLNSDCQNKFSDRRPKLRPRNPKPHLSPGPVTRSLPLARPSRASAFGRIPFAASRAAEVLRFAAEREMAVVGPNASQDVGVPDGAVLFENLFWQSLYHALEKPFFVAKRWRKLGSHVVAGNLGVTSRPERTVETICFSNVLSRHSSNIVLPVTSWLANILVSLRDRKGFLKSTANIQHAL